MFRAKDNKFSFTLRRVTMKIYGGDILLIKREEKMRK